MIDNKILIYNSLIIFFAFIFLTNCQTQKKLGIDAPCNTKYPILLVHGVAYRDDVPFIRYWSRLPKVLKKNGAKVFLANQNAFSSHVENALQLCDRVLEILEQTGSEKINIIAHSKGGIECRYMISKLDMADKVASLTTLATPHRGSYIADTIINWLNHKQKLESVINVANSYAWLIGDKNPNAMAAAQNLTLEFMQNFNFSVIDAPQVYYQSFGGVISKTYPVWMVRIQQKILSKKEGENDGIVSEYSYKWGNYKGIVKCEQSFGVSHFDIVGMRFISKQSTFDANGLIFEIVSELKKMGF